MAERKYTHGLKLKRRNDLIILDIGSMEIWDGADLSLLRDTMFSLVKEGRCTGLGVEMRYVQHIPSGFFGLLIDWYERGFEIRLLNPRERVMQMLWFRKYFTPLDPDTYRLHDAGDGIDEETSEDLWEAAPEFKYQHRASISTGRSITLSR